MPRSTEERRLLLRRMEPGEKVYYSTTFRRAIDVMSEDGKSQALACYLHYRDELRRLRADHGGPDDAASVAYSMHELVDNRIAEMLKRSKHASEIQCRAGCAHCCHIEVDISAPEAELLLQFARFLGLTLDLERLALQADHKGRWSELKPEDRRCVFLGDDNRCRVYEHRPSACRKYLVKTPPERCDSIKHPSSKNDIGVVFDMEAEIITSAANTVFDCDTLPRMLLKAKGKLR